MTFIEEPFDIGLNIKIKIDKFSIVLDAVLADNRINRGYIPVKFIPREQIKKKDKLLLSFYAYVLAEATTTLHPLNGKVIFGHKM